MNRKETSFLADVAMHRLICWGVLFAVQLHPISGWTKPVVSAQLSVMTVKDEVELHCDPQPPNTQWTCLFNSSSQKDLLTPTNKGHCTVTVKGDKLLEHNAGYKTNTHISCGCTLDNTTIYSENITVVVFNFDLPIKYTIIAMVVFGVFNLATLCVLAWGCYIILPIARNRTPPLLPRSNQNQPTNMDHQSTGSVKEAADAEKEGPGEDELFYATVRHPTDVRRSPQVYRFEQGTEYATVLIN
ncbi:uncharacterized protein LOC121680509 isoform X2 [Alosa sapidissima]|uniref:uncharacterized protein LOC121680509 isoform X2 n=1 Tax=Alosa sapidissima TaxID=34773 RepID=UPI001C088F6D|nr:uncharacterized protein LOC121680509 isoform X2 [Alosa sapidissima]